MSNRSFKFLPAENKSQWESTILNFPEGNFLQSWNWGEFQERLAKEVFRFFIMDSGKIVGMVQIVKEPASRGPYLSIAGGPLINWQDEELVIWLLNALKTEAKNHQAWFVRFRPQEIATDHLRNLVETWGAIESPMHLTADLTLQLDLSLSEEELLAGMRKNHRGLIRRAERDGIITKTSSDPEEIKEFCKWQEYLAEKHHFVPFSEEFLRTQFETFVKDDQAILVSSYFADELLATAFVIFYNGEAVYHYGISTPKNEKLPGSYAAQWRSIQEAKLRGCRIYNFWGIAPEDDKDHRFAGVSMFKRGFGGSEVNYLPAHDLPVTKLYRMTNLFEQVRKRKRNL